MEQKQYITGIGTNEIWQQVNEDFAGIASLRDYHVILQHGKYEITLDIDIHLGGAEEGGYETTIFTSLLPLQKDGYRLALHPEDFLQEIGKWLGLEDKEIGYPEFDKNVIVKTNDIAKTHTVFADSDVRLVFENLSGYSLGIVEDAETKVERLELYILRGITDVGELRGIYTAFFSVLEVLHGE